MSVSHRLTFDWGSTLTTTVVATGQVEGNASETVSAGNGNIVPLAWTNSKLQSIDIRTDVALTLTTNGVQQSETATVVASSGCTGNGSMSVVVTSGILAGSPVTYTVPVTTASNTAALVAAVCRAYLQTQTALTALYLVGGSGATISLTALLPAANDTSLNIATSTGTATGIATTATSANTTAGVAVQDTFSLGAGIPFVWCAGSGITNPFAGNVTGMVFTNYTAGDATLTVKSLATSP